ncbi:insulin-degrading enzyme-like isoform X2 [Physella acuta]|uniref:insulin-degrading enzyme-like isoform X2 n=1 Tax=Physella acuta TaxID=109671 RepID=UPI0027DE2DDE|nr:insulin-degrading enzyme-like isoform X2 [Physella acuta]XP_059153921.1 insulin-degrading enzyme-like isoform X2 [Physella acuta]
MALIISRTVRLLRVNILQTCSILSQTLQSGKSFSSAAMSGLSKVYNECDIIKSAADTRKYRGLELTNGMKVLLISDPETDKSSAAMDVNIGHLKDPDDLPGLAHFCEHMLFLGTEKYPEENEYNKFLSEHGGMSNAFTTLEHTNYYFDVSPDYLPGALDRFSQFFCCPLFTPSATGREVNAVDSENSRNLQSDPWRLFQLDKSLARPDHDFSKFGTGNKDTLETIPKSKGIDTRDELLKFHSQYYSSNIMSLCVLGRESLDELSQMVVPLFQQTVNKNVAVPRWDDPPYTSNQLQCIVHAIPVKDIREMSVVWPTPDLSEHYKANPGHYLGHLLGHEGSGSLLSELKARGWANTLVGGQKSGAKGFSFFSVAIDLTEKSQDCIEDIITLIYQYINMLRREGAQKWIFKECQDLAAMAFNFKDKEIPKACTSNLASRMQEFPMKDVLSAYALFDDFRPDLIQQLLDKLVPSNMRVTVVSKKFEALADQTEKWYGTQYKVTRLSPDQIQKWADSGLHENLRLPAQNEFIPSNFQLVSREIDTNGAPDIIKNTAFSRLWFKQDDKFLKPKACVNFDFISPIAYTDPLHTNLNSLFTQLFDDALTEYSYMAEIAGLKYSLDSSVYGLTLTIKGYNDKLPILLEKIVEKMASFKVDPTRLEIFKDIHGRNLRNFQAEQPHQHAIYYTNVLTSESLWTKDELLQALEDVTLENLTVFIKQLLGRLYIEALIYGNVTRSQAHEMMDLVEKILMENCKSKPLLASQHRKLREVQLPDGCYFLYKQKNLVHESSSVEVYYQCGLQNTESNMLLELFCQVISEPCFNILRTKEQLGYIVFSGVRRSKGVQGLRVIVQSSKPAQYVEERIEAFIQKMEEVLDKMSDEELSKHVMALSTKRLEKPKKLIQQNNKYWTEIISNYYNFDRDAIEVAFLQKLTKDDLLQFYKEKIALDAPNRHKLCVYVLSNTSDETPPVLEADGFIPAPKLPQPSVVTDVMEFKRDLGLYPLAKPCIDLTKAKL